ncbi:hypothetical protein CEXT_674371 [Caerostris extrusa]|uniref:Uncharacterized protein n=1 Tax=Caerostris extrusa TaxID=172846 RepID=A0AAV4QW09_CAEEX|nr:hypothetical protein CEXT_674371 [Caerostris extrusa]
MPGSPAAATDFRERKRHSSVSRKVSPSPCVYVPRITLHNGTCETLDTYSLFSSSMLSTNGMSITKEGTLHTSANNSDLSCDANLWCTNRLSFLS